MKCVARWVLNTGREQSQDIEAPNRDAAEKKAERLAKKHNARLIEVEEVEEFDGE